METKARRGIQVKGEMGKELEGRKTTSGIHVGREWRRNGEPKNKKRDLRVRREW